MANETSVTAGTTKPGSVPDSQNTPLASSLFSDFDLHLFGEGRHLDLYRRLGAQLRTLDGVRGTNFAVWAPMAKNVRLVGSFAGWGKDSGIELSPVADSGIWEKFIPGVEAGALYKFEIQTQTGKRVLKADPFAFSSERPPQTASVVTDLGGFGWGDEQWMKVREARKSLEYPISIYEVHAGSWQTDSSSENGWMNFRQIAHRLADYCQKMGFTHVELMPVTEHPYTGSWGYQTLGYFAATSRYGSPHDFMYFVDFMHRSGIGVIVDWVPAHFPRDAHGLARFDGTCLYEHADPRQGEHPDWGTLIFNYGRNEVSNFLLASAMFWCDKFHIDGLRVDAVASMLYLDYSRKEGQWVANRYGGKENLEAIRFIRQTNRAVHEKFPGVLMIAEESTAWPGVSHAVENGGLGFDLKWNMGWMNDTLKYMRNQHVHRKYHHDQLTFSLMYAWSENFLLPFSHDEVVHGKGSLIDQMSGDTWQKFANLRLLYVYQWMHPGKKLSFMGSEFGQWLEWNCDRQLAWDLLKEPAHQGIQTLVADLNRMLHEYPAMYLKDFSPEGFQWIDCHNRKESLLTWIRRGDNPEEPLITACNFTPQPHIGRRVGVPLDGIYREILNSDASQYGGSGMGNSGLLEAVAEPCDGFEHSICFDFSPLAGMVFRRESAK
jgi:1,4-alpha-glucan branching enzyme